jgi:hypothetical protein
MMGSFYRFQSLSMALSGSESLEDVSVYFLISIYIFDYISGYCFSPSIGRLSLREQLATEEFHSKMYSMVSSNASHLIIKVTTLKHSDCNLLYIAWS